ncbi:MAG: protein kinase [Acidobacteriota bacterium]
MNAETWQQLKPLFHAALELGPAERSAFLASACKDDGELRVQVEKLLAAHDEPGDFLVSPALVKAGRISADAELLNLDGVERAGQRVGAYEIIREIGHGGMGTVFLAVRADDEYRKQVAIKLVKRGMDTDMILRRFMMERQILANLEHPNIARLLDGGSTPDGLPYFVMEYVEGQPIDEYCDTQRFSTAERLELFRQVCAALQYAHQNLVVHRDIKPSNILVTAEGVPKLLDFGIAKLLSPGWATDTGDVTASMVRLMTPEYASPEQLRGLGITTASDVYSLGIVLYELLSGHHPYRLASRLPEEMAEAILRKEPPKPSVVITRTETERSPTSPKPAAITPESVSQTREGTIEKLRRRLSGDLDNIVLKALRKEPERRYASVQEFAEDIRRHLEGLPVTASPDTFGYRARKFTQRHKGGVLAAAVVVITLLTATSITTWQARVARSERAKAERRFNDVRQLAHSMVFELHDSIQNLPGSTPSRELLVSRALEYLDKLASEAGKEPSLQLELAAAYDKIGDIQGGFGTSHLGQRQKAGESYRKALAIREALVTEAPDNVDFRQKLSTSYTKLGDILWVEVDINGALQFYGKALATNNKLAAEFPNDTQIRLDLAKSYENFGYMQGANGRADEALENLRKAVVIMEELAAADPNNTKLQYELASSYDKVAEILTGLTPNHAEALILMRKAQKIGETLLAADPLSTKLRRGQAVGDFNVAMVSAKLGDTKTGLDSSRKALSIFTEMLSADPQNDEFRQAVASIQTFVCEMMIKNGNAAEAIKLLSESLLTLEKSFAASPTDETAHFRIGNVQAGLGQGHAALAADDKTSAEKRLTHWREARTWFQKSQEIFQGFRDAGKLTGEDSAKLDAVTEEIGKCDTAIARLTKK